MTAYYNEIDPYAAQWLRNLIDAGQIAPGDVDTRDIRDVRPSDLAGYRQCHFFAGVGVWSYALRQAGWPDDRPVWTGSCPCQPFSAAGKGAGFDDERHLWPDWFWLISQCRPAIVLGEQVASRDADAWLDLVSADMEGLGAAFGAVAFPSAGVGAPHIRDRCYWVADAEGDRYKRARQFNQSAGWNGFAHGGAVDRMADAVMQQRSDRKPRIGDDDATEQWDEGAATLAGLRSGMRPGPVNGFWRSADWLGCRDGKWRPVEPGLEPLVNGTASRVGRLRAYGNAINAEAARCFVEAVMEES